MDVSHLNYGIIHSLIGKNDGVSIVIDQTVNAMVKDMGIGLGNIYFLAAHSSPRFNAETDEVFWHKNEINKKIVREFSSEPDASLGEDIHENALVARDIIAGFVKRHSIDILIAHNTSHPYNFITAVGLGYYLEDLRKQKTVWPKVLVWWHDSYFERAQFGNPNAIILKYLKYLPGTLIDGIVFINTTQVSLAKRVFSQFDSASSNVFFADRTAIIPNTHDIYWDWNACKWTGSDLNFPPQDPYNKTFLKDIGLEDMVASAGYSIHDTLILLQHTRIVPRKKIETAIDLAFELAGRFRKDGQHKCVALLISGHSGDEQARYKEYLAACFQKRKDKQPEEAVFMIFGENYILSHRDIIVDKKYYNFFEIPGIVASLGGIGTYFSETEGFGNNLLEMIAAALPVVINRYDIYKIDLEPLGFNMPFIENNRLDDELVDKTYKLANDVVYRNHIVSHNLSILSEKLGHKVISRYLLPLINNIFTKSL